MHRSLRLVSCGLGLLALAIPSVTDAGDTISALKGVERIMISTYVDADERLAGVVDSEALSAYLLQALGDLLKNNGIVVGGIADMNEHYPPNTLILVLGVDMLPGPQDVIVDSVLLESFRYLKTELDPKRPMFVQCTRSVQYGGYSQPLLGQGLQEQINTLFERFVQQSKQFQ